MARKEAELVAIKPIETRECVVRIIGDTPLIVHAWSEKAKRQMLEAQMGNKKGAKKEPKNPVSDFIQSLYWLTPMPEEMTEDAFHEAISGGARFGFPATAVKQATISAAYRSGWTKDKVSLRGAFFIFGNQGGMLEIHSDPPIMREDMVKIGMGTADIRYRGEFHNWYIDMMVSYNKNGNYDFESILNMINAGGYLCGIGEWRPERDGTNGMYHVATE